MTSELLKCLNEQLGVFFKCGIEKLRSAKDIKRGFLSKNVFVCCNVLSLMLFKFLKISYILL